MPNGGGDNCGHCDHFSRPGRPGQGLCNLRQEEIESSFWTYCANHPYHSGETLPIGPIYVDAGGYPYRRIPWKNAPDTPEIRQRLREIARSVLDPNLQGVLYPGVMQPEYNAIAELVRLRDPEGRNILQTLVDKFPDQDVGKIAAAELEKWDQTENSES